MIALRRARLVPALIACLLGIAACGGGDESSDSQAETATTPQAATGPEAEEQARKATEEYFTAIRTGDTETICAREAEDFQVFKYGEPGQPCLDDLANQQEQPAYSETIKIGDLLITGTVASADVQPYLPAKDKTRIILRLTDGEWLVADLR